MAAYAGMKVFKGIKTDRALKQASKEAILTSSELEEIATDEKKTVSVAQASRLYESNIDRLRSYNFWNNTVYGAVTMAGQSLMVAATPSGGVTGIPGAVLTLGAAGLRIAGEAKQGRYTGGSDADMTVPDTEQTYDNVQERADALNAAALRIAKAKTLSCIAKKTRQRNICGADDKQVMQGLESALGRDRFRHTGILHPVNSAGGIEGYIDKQRSAMNGKDKTAVRGLALAETMKLTTGKSDYSVSGEGNTLAKDAAAVISRTSYSFNIKERTGKIYRDVAKNDIDLTPDKHYSENSDLKALIEAQKKAKKEKRILGIPRTELFSISDASDKARKTLTDAVSENYSDVLQAARDDATEKAHNGITGAIRKLFNKKSVDRHVEKLAEKAAYETAQKLVEQERHRFILKKRISAVMENGSEQQKANMQDTLLRGLVPAVKDHSKAAFQEYARDYGFAARNYKNRISDPSDRFV